MIELSQARSKRLLAVHGWAGTVLGLALYVVILTGAVVVFAHEIGTWSVSGTRAQQPLAAPMDAKIRELAGQVDPEYLDDLNLFHNGAGHISAFFHTHAAKDDGHPMDKGVRFTFDPVTGETLTRQEGFGDEFEDPLSALDHFLVELHVNLHAPEPVGLYLTGILGFAMLAAAVSGFLLHRHLIKDLFVAPRLSSRLLNARDRHILAGSWGLPFAFVLAFTGAFLSFAGSIGLMTISMAAFGGDQQKLIETIIGMPEAEDATPAQPADLDAMLRQSAEMSGNGPAFVAITHYGRADARVYAFHLAAEGGLQSQQHVFKGSDGAYLGPKPSIGSKPSAGDAAFTLMGVLHFGTFAGLLSRVIWFALGLAMCYVTLTGLQLWLRRRADSPLWRRLGRSVPIVGYGLPIALAASGISFFLSLSAGTMLFWTPAGFLIAAGLSIAIGCLLRDETQLYRLYRGLLGATLIALPLLRWLMGGIGWDGMLESGNDIVILLDLALAAGGLGYLYIALAHRREPRWSGVEREVAAE
ncbi:MAG: PepSY domain-containing protein [Alphaproteobacteria bacterium]|nr:PepSY domain-containing protein [Alphaproteobacteria bacterium]